MDNCIKLTTCESGDWKILEVNGTKWVSSHSISEDDWLDLLSEHFDCKVEYEYISDEEMEERC